MYENVKTVDGGGFSSAAMGFLKGVLVAAVFTLAIFAVASLILSYTPLPESMIPYIAFVSHGIASAISGFIPAKRAGTRGLITGGLSALFYMLIIWLLASLVADGFFMGQHIFIMFAISLILGALGGIFGVNFKSSNNNKKKR